MKDIINIFLKHLRGQITSDTVTVSTMASSASSSADVPYLPLLSNISLIRKIYTLGYSAGENVNTYLSTSRQIDALRQFTQTLATTTLSDLITIVPSALENYRQWWLDLVQNDPVHVVIETILLSFLIYMFLIRKKEKFRNKMADKLSDNDIKGLLKVWKDKERYTLTDIPIYDSDSGSSSCGTEDNILVIDAMKGSNATVRIQNTKDKTKFQKYEALNFATFDFLGMSCPADDDEDGGGEDVVKKASKAALEKYGCGSCGPRGFYGTIDAHLDLENAMAKFTKTDGAILYSDGAAMASSTIAAFAKRGDLLVVDEAVYEALITGVVLSRANVKYFRHNDMDDLRRVLKECEADDKELGRKKNDQRRFIIVEALYKNQGTLCPLDEVVALKEEFCYRLILDESFSFGVLGKTGKGALEHFGKEYMQHAEMVTISLENSLGSIGGVTVGNEQVVDHQRLSGAGYCFSASSPPFLSCAAQASLNKMQAEPQLILKLQDNIKYCYAQMPKTMRDLMPSKMMITSDEESPMVYLQLTKNDRKPLSRVEQVELLDDVVSNCLEHGLMIVSTGGHTYDHLHKIPPPSLRLTIMAKQSKADIDTALKVLKNAILNIVK